MKLRSKEKDGENRDAELRARGRFEAGLWGVLKSSREKTNCATGKIVDGRRATAGRQIDFPSLRDARRFGRRD
jgi:hypothetical protein